MKELNYPFDPEWIISNKKKIKKALLAENTTFLDKKIAILGGSTTNALKTLLEVFLLNQGINPTFYESEYNQYYQDAMFPNAELEEFAPDVIYIHTSNRNIDFPPAVSDSREDVQAKLDGMYKKLEGMWEHLSEVYHCPIIQNNFEPPLYRLMGNKDASDYRGMGNFITKLNLKLYEYADTHNNFYIHDIAYEAADYGLKEWSAPFYWHMYKYACAVPALPYMAFQLSNIIKSIYGKNKKVLALDLDNTLWGGVIGDDGAENIEIGQETPLAQTYSEFQKYIRAHKEIGVILAVLSKNEADVAKTGFERPDSILKYDDFVSFKANWEPKSGNLIQTAAELNLLPESFVFVDDNPAEREIVRQAVPAAVPEISEPENYLLTLDRSGFFEVTSFSDEDRKRSEMYAANAKREILINSFENYEDYLKSLEMHAEIQHFIPEYMGRIAQLSNKSNQFNLTTRRYTQAEIEEVASDNSYIDIYGKLEDKFGDNGVVSVVIGKKKEKALHIDLWIMSCRVLKRDMEKAMLDAVIDRSVAEGVEEIYGYYYPTAKNAMVKNFFESLGFQLLNEDESGNKTYRLGSLSEYTHKNTAIKVN